MISPAYPNPFNPTTTIELSIPASGVLVIQVFDLLGYPIETLMEKNIKAGEHIITWNASSIPSGMYLIKAEMENFSNTQKVLLLK